ncbi:MAG: polynucleotide adenylyltransferase PcnB [Neisseriaceae bacterium]|nr:MAG: polynucleotide adenylyltransferase PcnB [Neisseriaceae bacterium]
MLKIFKNLLSKKFSNAPETTSEIIPMSSLNLSPSDISKDALQVIDILHDNNYEAFIVGGAIRDLILNQTPKDFDIATNAPPEEIKKIFRRAGKHAQIIGKRFPIVHVYTGRQTLEVSTFRSQSNYVNHEGRIIQDNQYGSIHDDANRRDFTCNALYLDPINQNIHSYHNALQHLENKKLIMIGEIETRLKEDPIRIIRAARIAVKTNLTIETSLLENMQKNAYLLPNEPGSRLFDEWVKIIYSKHAYQCILLLKKLKILPFIHPITKVIFEYHSDNDKSLVKNTLQQTDYRLQNNQSISLGFVISALLWPIVEKKWQYNQSQGMKPPQALHEAILSVMNEDHIISDIPNKNIASMNEIWLMQNRLETAKSRQQIQKLLNHPRFRAAYDFFVLRTKSNNINENKVQWWTKIIENQTKPPTNQQNKNRNRKPSKTGNNQTL